MCHSNNMRNVKDYTNMSSVEVVVLVLHLNARSLHQLQGELTPSLPSLEDRECKQKPALIFVLVD
jgi:hypothetical protein